MKKLPFLLCCLVFATASIRALSGTVSVVSQETETITLLNDNQDQFQVVVPPSTNTIYIHRLSRALPVDFSGFETNIISQLYADMVTANSNLYPIYTVIIKEERSSRDRVLYNSFGTEVWRKPSPIGYNPYAFLLALFGVDDIFDINPFYRTIFDPAHIALEISLIPEIFYDTYLADMALDNPPPEPVVTQPVTSLTVGVREQEGVDVNIKAPDSFQGLFDIVGTTNLSTPRWELVLVGEVSGSITNIYLKDENPLEEDSRFFAATAATFDTDLDLLPDAYEYLIFGTDAENPDADGDGILDGDETHGNGEFGDSDGVITDPFSPDKGDFNFPDLAVFEPAGTYPPEFNPFTPPTSLSSANAGTPEISEWTRQNQPGDTMILSGEALSETQYGRDPRFKFFGQVDERGGILTDGRIQRLAGQHCAITISTNMPNDEVYMMWAENANGFGAPILINQTELWWVGPDRLAAGEVFSVYGRNLSLGGNSCWLYIEELDQWVESFQANPYKADFVFPDSAPNGTYTVYAHNGFGRKYGWSVADTVQVLAPLVWSGPVLDVTDPSTWPGYSGSSGGAVGDGVTDDFPAIQDAYNVAKNTPYSTLYFPEGHYMLSDTLYPNAERIRYQGAGMDKTILQTFGPEDGYVGFFNTVIMMRSTTAIEDMELNKGDVQGNAVTAQGGAGTITNLYFNNARLSSLSRGPKQDNFALQTVNMQVAEGYLYFKDCEFIGSGTMFLTGGFLRQFFLDGCEFIGIDDSNGLMGWSQREMSMVNCYAHPLDPSDDTDRLGWCKGRWVHGGGNTIGDLYVGDCVSSNMGPRYPSFEVAGVVVEVENNPAEYSVNRLRVEEDLSGLDIVEGVSFEGASLQYIGDGHGNPGEGRGYRVLTIDQESGWVDIERDWNTADFQVGDSYMIRETVDQNAGEQFMWEALPTYFADYAETAIDNRTISFGANLTQDLTGKTFFISDGRGAGQSGIVESMDTSTGTIVLEQPLRVLPDTTSLCKLGDSMYRMVYFNNDLNGYERLIEDDADTATCALNAYGCSGNLVFVSNKVSTVESGVMYFSYGADAGVNAGPNGMAATFYNHVEGNQFRSLKMGIGISPDPDEEFNINTTMMGHTYRKNTFVDMRREVIGYSTKDGVYRADLNVFERNEASEFNESIVRDDNVQDQVYLGNTFVGNGGTGFPLDASALKINSWEGFDTEYASAEGGKLELPIRYVDAVAPSQSVQVWNSGTAPMYWIALEASPWLTFVPAEGSITSNLFPSLSVTAAGGLLDDEDSFAELAFDIDLAAANGEAIITILANGTAKQITVSAEGTAVSSSLYRTVDGAAISVKMREWVLSESLLLRFIASSGEKYKTIPDYKERNCWKSAQTWLAWLGFWYSRNNVNDCDCWMEFSTWSKWQTWVDTEGWRNWSDWKNERNGPLCNCQMDWAAFWPEREFIDGFTTWDETQNYKAFRRFWRKSWNRNSGECWEDWENWEIWNDYWRDRKNWRKVKNWDEWKRSWQRYLLTRKLQAHATEIDDWLIGEDDGGTDPGEPGPQSRPGNFWRKWVFAWFRW